MRNWLIGSLLALVVVPLEAQKIGSDAPDLVWKGTCEFGDIANKKLSDLRGSVVLLVFFKMHSAASRDEIKRLNSLHADKSEVGLVVVGVTEDDAADVTAWAKEAGVKFPIGVCPPGDYVVRGIPDSFLIDKDGKVAWRGHPAALEQPLLEKSLAGAKPAVVVKGLEELASLRRANDHGSIWRKAKQMLEAGGLSPRAQAQATDWIQTIEQFVTRSVADADKAEQAKDVYGVWAALEPVALFYQGAPGADAVKTRFDTLLADARNKKEIEAGKKFAEGKVREAAFEFDAAHACYKETERLFGSTKAGRAAGLAWKAIEKDGKLGYQHTCGYCKAGGAACPEHKPKKKK
ncbi:MAG TPA: TlpA disulfide reductase family protein [Planctomycetota bacterium]